MGSRLASAKVEWSHGRNCMFLYTPFLPTKHTCDADILVCFLIRGVQRSLTEENPSREFTNTFDLFAARTDRRWLTAALCLLTKCCSWVLYKQCVWFTVRKGCVVVNNAKRRPITWRIIHLERFPGLQGGFSC